ncbi:MAG: hypothetical protein ABIO99_00925 [Candidatus Limnocylindria bacterium]
MARRILVIAAIAWGLAGIGGLVLAAIGTQGVLLLLPPLAIDADALGGAITTLAIIVLAVAAAHAVVILAMRRWGRPATSAGILLAAILSVACLALVTAAVTSAIRTPDEGLLLGLAAAAAGVGSVAYALVTIGLVRELSSESAA